MRPWLNRVALGATLIGLLLFTIVSVPTVAAASLKSFERAVNAWRLGDANKILEEISEKEAQRPRYQFVLGKLLFFQGDFDGALRAINSAIEGGKAEYDWKYLKQRVLKTRQVFDKMTVINGRSGRFRYRFADTQDAILIRYADVALAAQVQALDAEFGNVLSSRTEVVILPSVRALSDVTGLSTEQIERTGTVAVTKYGRIYLLTPRRLAYGYPWLDTLAHELTHVVITMVSDDRAPIWLHEGVAKMLEGLWRGQSLQTLTPQEAYLLDMAARQARLIPLSRFHPSVANLPGQEDAALAYAQVLSFLSYLDERYQSDWVRVLLESLAAGGKLNDGILQITKLDLNKIYRWWLQSISGKRQTPVPAVALMKRRFKRGKVAGDLLSETELEDNVRRYLRLGDLLRMRGHNKAAVREYEKARRLMESPSPVVIDRLAGVLIDAGQYRKAAEILPEITGLYPHHSTSQIQLGLALEKLGQKDKAAKQLELANRLHPFNPDIHCTLAILYTELGQTEASNLEKENCRLLVGGTGLEDVSN